jgi:hypothetical protein
VASNLGPVIYNREVSRQISSLQERSNGKFSCGADKSLLFRNAQMVSSTVEQTNLFSSGTLKW